MTHPAADDDQWEALARYLTGESTPAEAAGVERWLAEHPEEAARLTALGRLTRSPAPPALHIDVEAAWQRTRPRMKETAPLPFARPEPSPKRWVPLVAAAVLVLALGGLYLWRVNPGIPALTSRTVTTAIGQRDSISFADGSRILLGPATQVVLTALGEGRPTGVRLDGEAYFDLPHDPAHPLSVLAGDAVITDIGTRFTVRHGPRETEVEVHEGSVGFGVPGADSLVLVAGARALRTAGGRPLQVPGQVEPGSPGWTEGRLAFDAAGFPRVQQDLRRWFGVELVASDSSLVGRHFTASFAGESREEIIRILALTVGAEVEWRGDTARLFAPPQSEKE